MKHSKRILSLILALTMVLATGIGCITAFAAEASDEQPYSSTDTSATGGTTKHFSDYELVDFKVPAHRISMKIPQMDMGFNMNSTNKEISEVLGNRYLKDIINYGDLIGNCYSYVYSTAANGNDVSSYMIYYSNFYTKFIGDFKRLSSEQLEDLCTSKPFFSEADAYPEIHEINGQPWLYQEYLNNEDGIYTYALQTIIKGGAYELRISCLSPTNGDIQKISEMLSTIRIGGYRNSYMNAASNDAFIVLCVITALLAIAVALLAYYLVKLNKRLAAAPQSSALTAPAGDDPGDDEDGDTSCDD